jgi:hypothetical protein
LFRFIGVGDTGHAQEKCNPNPFRTLHLVLPFVNNLRRFYRFVV